MAAALITVVPATASMAATRPNAAVPMASTAVVAAQYNEDDNGGISWIAIAAIGVAAAVALWIVLDDDDDGEGALSRA